MVFYSLVIRSNTRSSSLTLQSLRVMGVVLSPLVFLWPRSLFSANSCGFLWFLVVSFLRVSSVAQLSPSKNFEIRSFSLQIWYSAHQWPSSHLLKEVRTSNFLVISKSGIPSCSSVAQLSPSKRTVKYILQLCFPRAHQWPSSHLLKDPGQYATVEEVQRCSSVAQLSPSKSAEREKFALRTFWLCSSVAQLSPSKRTTKNFALRSFLVRAHQWPSSHLLKEPSYQQQICLLDVLI